MSACLHVCTVHTVHLTAILFLLARSPLYSHISASLQGLTTIRACERQDAFIAYFHAYQNEQSKGWSVFLMTSRWFGIRIDTISAIFVGIVAFSAIPLTGRESGTLCRTSSSMSLPLKCFSGSITGRIRSLAGAFVWDVIRVCCPVE